MGDHQFKIRIRIMTVKMLTLVPICWVHAAEPMRDEDKQALYEDVPHQYCGYLTPSNIGTDDFLPKQNLFIKFNCVYSVEQTFERKTNEHTYKRPVRSGSCPHLSKLNCTRNIYQNNCNTYPWQCTRLELHADCHLELNACDIRIIVFIMLSSSPYGNSVSSATVELS
jgi:hypothetical protein